MPDAPDQVDVLQLTEADFDAAADAIADHAARMAESRGSEASAMLQGAALFEETLRERLDDD